MNNSWNSGSLSNSDDYYNKLEYDAVGNITHQFRRANTVSGGSGAHNNDMDDMTYHYTPGTNRLDYVTDAGDNANTTVNLNDIKAGQSTSNYQYDDIGNLTRDVSEGIAVNGIEWTSFGKIAKVTHTPGFNKNGNFAPDLEFKYTPSGKRWLKIVKPRNSSGLQGLNTWTYQVYTYDASDNVLATYKGSYSYLAGTYTEKLELQDQAMYGSSRLGTSNPSGVPAAQVDFVLHPITGNKFYTVPSPWPNTPTAFAVTSHIAGEKRFELSNHLMNVLTTISDRKLMVNSVANTNWSNNWSAVGSGANVSVNGNNISISSSNVWDGAVRSINTVPGTVYTIDLDAHKGNASAMGYEVWDQGYTKTLAGIWISVNGHYSLSFMATTTTSHLKVLSNDGSNLPVGFAASNIMVREPMQYVAQILSSSDYYAFGMGMHGRESNSNTYRFGFNGKEKDIEGMGGGGSTYDYGFRIYNEALGKFLSVDPLFKSYPMLTPYQFASNMPTVAIDLDGLEAKVVINIWDQHPDGTFFIKESHSVYSSIQEYKYEPDIEGGKYKTGYGLETVVDKFKGAIFKETNTIVPLVFPHSIFGGLKSSINYDYTNPESMKQKEADDEAWIKKMSEKRGFDPVYYQQLKNVIRERDHAAGDNKIAKQQYYERIETATLILPLLRFGPVKAALIEAGGCEKIALALQKKFGGEFLQITGPGRTLGEVVYTGGTITKWNWHVANIRDGRVYDALTGIEGMELSAYKALFTEAKALNFEVTKQITLK